MFQTYGTVTTRLAGLGTVCVMYVVGVNIVKEEGGRKKQCMLNVLNVGCVSENVKREIASAERLRGPVWKKNARS